MIQRSYSLPSCTLMIEGISTGGNVLSILTNFACRFNHHAEPIVGGLELLNTLIKVVGDYAQSLKSSTSVVVPEKKVRLEPEGQHIHVLSVSQSEADAQNPQEFKIKLNTIQLFDLMESLDRLCCDPTTLPDVKLVAPIINYKPQFRLSKQAIPAIAGVFGLAIAGTVLYLLPLMKPEPKPTTPTPVQTSPLPKKSAPPTPSITPESSSNPDTK
ncbi:DUF4335 domain-containing protein [Pseudanabaena biceps]|nr:DUF4335 domain-containing protein [Pseudanabaena biceps]